MEESKRSVLALNLGHQTQLRLSVDLLEETTVKVAAFMGSHILADIVNERERQDAKWGEQNHPDGTGSESDKQSALLMKDVVNGEASLNQSNWANILMEEILEAYAETDPALLRKELIQSAAVIVAWIEAIDRRAK